MTSRLLAALKVGTPIALVALSGALAVPAAATPPAGTSAKILSKDTVDGKDYIVAEITIAPGGSTGWHTHRGTVFGIVEAGTLTRNGGDCSLEGISNPGDPITDPTGADHVHLGRNLGATPVVLEVTYVDPAGTPTGDSAPNPGCDFE